MKREDTANSPPSISDLQSLFSEAFARHRAGDLAAAAELYLRVLAEVPDNVNLLCNLGILYRDMGEPAEALVHLQRAAALDPANPMVDLNLGAVYEERNDFEGAAAVYRRALTTAPDEPRLLNNLGKALYRLGETEAALEHLQRAVRLAPEYPLARNNLGVLLGGLGRAGEAVDCLRLALAAEPDNPTTLYNLAGALNAAGSTAEAATHYRRVLLVAPNHAPARHMLAALTGDTPERAPADYVVDTFDRYAARFDAQLTEQLGYQVPEMLREVVAAVAGPAQYRHGLDLGCGTGLSGLAFRPLAATLTGVDLSAGMLAQARTKEVYDQLHQDDILSYLERGDERFDLILATDVFIYLGDLAPVFAAVRKRVTPPPAHFAFSIERATDCGDYELRPSGRYAQSVGYILGLAQSFDFAVTANEERPIRKEQGEWLDGNLFVLSIP